MYLYAVFFSLPRKRRATEGSVSDSVPVVTPVRRSTRFTPSSAGPASCTPGARMPARGTLYPALEYSALEEVPSPERALFQPNQALEALLTDSPLVTPLSDGHAVEDHLLFDRKNEEEVNLL